MRILKLLSVAVLSAVYLVLSTITVHASNEFSVDATVTYNIQDSGKTTVIHNITLENNFSNLYATNYTLGLENIDVTNVSAYSSDGTSYSVDSTKDGSQTNIKISFPDSVVGKGEQRHFSISYDNSTFAVRTGEVWEVSIPRLDSGSSFRSYQVVLNIPKSFGLEAYITPAPSSSSIGDTGYSYSFNRSSMEETGINAGYGQFQVFSFNLSYHLENPLSRSATTEIALPPDTAFQKVYIEKINPKPTNVKIDEDGNWIAIYDLTSRQRIDVAVSGCVQIFASYRNFPKATTQQLNDNLKETEYWQTSNSDIQTLAKKLKTAEAIYKYVSDTLHYNSERVQSNAQRMGAVAALENPNQAICMEFTDLFIAIARAAGIPAREINGYAYTENPDLQPLGLVADVLHSWPEYYDTNKGVWIPVDPTWASTSGGVDYFNKLDLRHFAFVIHGADDNSPYPAGSYKLGSNPQKDVYVSFGQLPDGRVSTPTVSIKVTRSLPFFSSLYTVTIGNPGPAALYSIYPTIYYDSAEKDRELIQALPPYSNTQIQVTLPYSFLGKDTPNIIKVSVGGTTAELLTNKKQVVTYGLLMASFVLIIVMLIILVRLKKIKIYKLFAKIGARKSKNEKPVEQNTENKDNPQVLP